MGIKWKVKNPSFFFGKMIFRNFQFSGAFSGFYGFFFKPNVPYLFLNNFAEHTKNFCPKGAGWFSVIMSKSENFFTSTIFVVVSPKIMENTTDFQLQTVEKMRGEGGISGSLPKTLFFFAYITTPIVYPSCKCSDFFWSLSFFGNYQ